MFPNKVGYFFSDFHASEPQPIYLYISKVCFWFFSKGAGRSAHIYKSQLTMHDTGVQFRNVHTNFVKVDAPIFPYMGLAQLNPKPKKVFFSSGGLGGGGGGLEG
jgi:hypothetical protein